jgi:4-amino-4-deoxy-L-arabinose transferase-like glycosyltransferase
MASPERKSDGAHTASPAGWFTPARLLVLIMLLVFAVRMLSILTRQIVQFDETAYLRMAENLAAGMKPWDISGVTDTHYAPLLPMFIAAFSFLFQDFIFSGYVVVALFGSLLVLPTYLLGRELVNQKTGLMAAALTGITPIYISTSEYIYSEMLYIFFMLFGVFFGWRMFNKRTILSGALAGLSLGLAYLASPSALFYFVILLILLLAVALGKKTWRRSLLPVSGIFVASFALFAAPYIWYLHHELDRWTYSGKFIAGNIYSATNNIPRDSTNEWEKALLPLTEDGSEVKVMVLERDPTLNNPVNFVLHYPVQATKNFVKQVYTLHAEVLQQVFPLWLLPLIGLGLFGSAWDRRRSVAVGFLALMATPVLLVLSMLTFPRFFMPFIPFAMIFVGQGWQRLEDWGREMVSRRAGRQRLPRGQRMVPWAIGALVLLPLLVLGGLTLLRHSYNTGYKEAGLWLKENEGSGKIVMCRDYSSAYYAGGYYLGIPYDSYERTTEYAKSKGVDYLVIDKRGITELRPGMGQLLDEDSAHDEWRLVHRDQTQTDKETMIFQLVK